MFKLLKLYPSIAIATLPYLAFAQPQPGPVNSLIDQIESTFNLIITFLFLIATLFFLWGIVSYLIHADDPAAQKSARSLMLWGIIGLAVITAVWGIVNVVIGYFLGTPNVDIPSEPGAI